jgi:hypothetical protein
VRALSLAARWVCTHLPSCPPTRQIGEPAAPLFLVVNPRHVRDVLVDPDDLSSNYALLVLSSEAPCRALPLEVAFEHNPCQVFAGRSEPILIIDLRLSNHSGHGKLIIYLE